MIKKIIAALAAAGTLVMVAQADSRSNATPAAVPTLERSGFEHLRELDLKADLYFLSSDALQGRMSLQAGDEAAVQWVASEFAKAGLEPIGRHHGAGRDTRNPSAPFCSWCLPPKSADCSARTTWPRIRCARSPPRAR
jgi:hypothetical protein